MGALLSCVLYLLFFFFKQKTAYEMRISDWIQTCALPISVAPRMLGNDIIALTDDDAGRIGVDLRRAPQRAGRHRVLVVIEPHEQRLGDGRGDRKSVV